MKEFEEVTAVTLMQQAGLNPLKQYHSLNARWACETNCCGRLVLTSFTSVKISGFECEYCGTNSSRVYEKNKIEYVRELVESRGGRLISSDYENTFSLVQVKCVRSHLFEIPFYLVQRNRWCPFCGTGKSERITRNIFEQLFGYPFPKRRPRWLVDDQGVRMELDGYCKELQIAFEFQGFQHFLETDVFDVNLTNLQINDNKKIAICKKKWSVSFCHELRDKI